jgi:hypothetical protein
LKTITNTLLIAAIFTSNIVASQSCIGTQCLATFAKPVAYKVTPSFKQNSISAEEKMHNNNIVEQPFFQDNIVSDDQIVEIEITDNAPATEVYSEDSIQSAEYDFEETEMSPIVINNSIEDIMIETLAIETLAIETLAIETFTMDEDTKLSINLETICKDNQELVSCDRTSESTECVCV